ncbi:MAG: NAD-dependent epimerase/dehydratase family protein [Clostridia bacterium]|nr:NAD-dependent epimerase/dehydratase family protein [Clostridia bacterium]
MKKILITGKGSYIGETFKNYILNNYCDYSVDTLDMLDENWAQKDFSGYDAIFHVAGIAHIKETKENASLYYRVNCDLAYEVAKKAKDEKVDQFVFLSSMSVYGKDTGIITLNTIPAPVSNYGKSKLMAEEKINALSSPDFKVAVLRPPMVYGKDCKGNFQLLKKLAQILPVFPRVNNKRSMIYINNLCEFVKLIIENEKSGLFFPQNREYVKTLDIVKEIAAKNGKNIYFSFLFGFGVLIMMPFVSKIQKAFGTLIYEIDDEWNFSYCKVDTKDSLGQSL